MSGRHPRKAAGKTVRVAAQALGRRHSHAIPEAPAPRSNHPRFIAHSVQAERHHLGNQAARWSEIGGSALPAAGPPMIFRTGAACGSPVASGTILRPRKCRLTSCCFDRIANADRLTSLMRCGTLRRHDSVAPGARAGGHPHALSRAPARALRARVAGGGHRSFGRLPAVGAPDSRTSDPQFVPRECCEPYAWRRREAVNTSGASA